MVTDQDLIPRALSRDAVRERHRRQRAVFRRRLIGIPALAIAAGIFGYGVWMLVEGEPDPQVEGITVENTTTTTSPDAFPEDPAQLPGVDLNDPAFDDSTAADPTVEIGTAISVERDPSEIPTSAP